MITYFLYKHCDHVEKKHGLNKDALFGVTAPISIGLDILIIAAVLILIVSYCL